MSTKKPPPTSHPTPTLTAWRARFETVLLAFGLLWTLVGKHLSIRWLHPPRPLLSDLDILAADVIVFSVFFALVALAYALRPTRGTARAAALATTLFVAWAVVNTAWLIGTGVQTNPPSFYAVISEPRQFGPAIVSHIRDRPLYAIPLAITILPVGAYMLWQIVRPRLPSPSRRRHLLQALRAGLVALVVFALTPLVERASGLGFDGEALRFSAHWQAARYLLQRPDNRLITDGTGREIPRAGQRNVVPPAPDPAPPNVVLVLLESVGYWATSMADPQSNRTPTLARLAREGIEFTQTRALVTHTTKSIFAVLTGISPGLGGDFAEAVMRERPYESLATILRARGYRSGFFQMAKGVFECNPGLFWNLGFDEFRSRENLEDESAHLGYLAGDDMRMIQPAFDWARSAESPFLLVLMSSVAHDPYPVPQWFAAPAAEPRDRYFQAVAFTDLYVQRIVEGLEQSGLAANTLLCVMADHGQAFGEHGLFGHNEVPYEEGLRVPWIIRWPGAVEAGRKVDHSVSLLDATPTLLALLGYDVTRAGFEGVDALAPPDPRRRVLFSGWFDRSPRGYVQGSRKVILFPMLAKLVEYDIAADPGERHPQVLDGEPARREADHIIAWHRQTQIPLDVRLGQHRMLFGHWRTFSSGRRAWTLYHSRSD